LALQNGWISLPQYQKSDFHGSFGTMVPHFRHKCCLAISIIFHFLLEMIIPHDVHIFQGGSSIKQCMFVCAAAFARMHQWPRLEMSPWCGWFSTQASPDLTIEDHDGSLRINYIYWLVVSNIFYFP